MNDKSEDIISDKQRVEDSDVSSTVGSNATSFLSLVKRFVKGAGSSEESGSARDGLLSYSGEWHAIVLGVAIGYNGNAELKQAFVGYVLGRGTLKSRARGKTSGKTSGHVKDAADEPAYALAGLMLGQGLKTGEYTIPNVF